MAWAFDPSRIFIKGSKAKGLELVIFMPYFSRYRQNKLISKFSVDSEVEFVS